MAFDFDAFGKFTGGVQGASDGKKEYISEEARELIKARDRGLCRLCGRQGKEVGDTHIHHIEPRGVADLENLVTLCRPCHQAVHCVLFVLGKHQFVNVLSGPRRWV